MVTLRSKGGMYGHILNGGHPGKCPCGQAVRRWLDGAAPMVGAGTHALAPKAG